MDLKNERKLLNMSKELFSWTMMDPHSKLRRFVIGVTLLINMLMLYLTFQLIKEDHYTITSMAYGVRSMVIYLQLFPKLLAYVKYKDALQELEEGLNKFWTTDTNINDAAFALCLFVAKCLKYLDFVAVTVILACPIFTKSLFFDLWVPNFIGAFTMLWLLQWYQITSNMLIVLSADLFFIACCLNVIGQLKILNYNVERLKNQNHDCGAQLVVDMKKCIRHHQFLLSYINNLINCYSLTLLIQYLLSMYALCTVLYTISDMVDLFDYVANGMLITVLTLQLAVYCFPADAVTEAAEKTSIAIYSCEWYNYPNHIQKNVLDVMTRAQKELVFSAGGLVVINKQTFTLILKGAFTFYTAIKQLRDQEK